MSAMATKFGKSSRKGLEDPIGRIVTEFEIHPTKTVGGDRL